MKQEKRSLLIAFLFSILFAASLTIVGCGEDGSENGVITPFTCLAGEISHYQITTITYSGNAIGKTQSVSGYRASYYQERLQSGANHYEVYDFETAGPAVSEDDLTWLDFPGFSGFDVTISGYDDLPDVIDELSGVPHESIDSFNIYVTLMDIIMYEQFRVVAVEELLNAERSTYTKEPYGVTLPDWEPVLTNIRISAGPTVFQHVNSDIDSNLFYYKTDDTHISQMIFEAGFFMPSRGTSRYMGFYRLDAENEVTYATLSEYYTGLVIAAYFLPVMANERREQVVELLENVCP